MHMRVHQKNKMYLYGDWKHPFGHLKDIEKTKLMRNMKTEKGHSLYAPVTPAHFSSLIQVSPFQQKKPESSMFFSKQAKKVLRA